MNPTFSPYLLRSTLPHRFVVAVIVFTVCCTPSVSPSATWQVPQDFPTVTAALGAAAPLDTVLVAPGTYSPATGETFPLVLATDGVVLRGAGMNLSILDASQTAGVLEHTAEVGGKIFGFTIRGGLSGDGAGLRVSAGDVEIAHNLFLENGATLRGAGLLLERPALPTIAPFVHHNVFWGNYDAEMADVDDPHGIFITQQVTGIVENNLIARSDGNGLLANLGSQPSIRQNIFLENGIATPTPRGRGICWLAGTPPRIFHNLFFANVVAALLWPAGGGNMSGGFANAVSPADFIYGNLDANPLLVDGPGGDYTLAPGSPAIDAGDPLLPIDPDATIADIGPFYFDQTAVDAPLPANDARPALTVFPNPFRAFTKIRLEIATEGATDLRIVDAAGRLVRTLAGSAIEGRAREAVWDGRTDAGAEAAPGLYFVHAAGGGVSTAAPIVRLR